MIDANTRYRFSDLEFITERFSDVYEDFIGDEKRKYPGRVFDIAQNIQALCVSNSDTLLAIFQLDSKCRPWITQALHCATICEILGVRHGIEKEERLNIVAAALTHDIGMLGLHETLAEQSGPLSAAQKAELNLHPIRSVKLLKDAGVSEFAWLDAVLHHHERLDGSGYPNGIAYEKITMGARLVAIADIYTAMVKPKAHRKELLAKQALSDLFVSRGDKIDNDLTQIFIKEMGIFPPGAIVRLTNGEIAVVTHRGENTTYPIVQSFVAPRGAPMEDPIVRNTKHEAYSIRDMEPLSAHRATVYEMRDQLWSRRRIT